MAFFSSRWLRKTFTFWKDKGIAHLGFWEYMRFCYDIYTKVGLRMFSYFPQINEIVATTEEEGWVFVSKGGLSLNSSRTIRIIVLVPLLWPTALCSSVPSRTRPCLLFTKIAWKNSSLNGHQLHHHLHTVYVRNLLRSPRLLRRVQSTPLNWVNRVWARSSEKGVTYFSVTTLCRSFLDMGCRMIPLI